VFVCGPDVSSGIESLLHRLQQQQQQQQPSFVPSPYPPTPPQLSLHTPAVVGRGSFSRSSASSGEGSSLIVASRVPPSILKQPPAVSLRPDVSLVHAAVPTVTPGSMSTPINAKSLHLPPGVDLNDVISEMFKPPVHQNVTPVRKSSLVSPRSVPPTSASTDVTRSTSLRQPAKSDWPPLRHGFISTQLNLSAVPSPVDAVFQHISFASPMTVTSNPVHSAASTATPPAYHPPPAYNTATNVEQLTFSSNSAPQRSNHVGTTPVAPRPQHDLLWPASLGVQGHAERRPYFDSLVAENSANSSLQPDPATSTKYHVVPVAAVESRPAQLFHEDSQTPGTGGKPVGPPSYQAAKSLKINALTMTPPTTKRYFEDIEHAQQARFPAHLSDQSNDVTVCLTNGDANRTYVAAPAPLLVTNGQLEPVANGPTMHVSTPQTRPVGMAVSQSASAPVNRHVSFLTLVCSLSGIIIIIIRHAPSVRSSACCQ